jgi:hypothetical protein
MIRRHGTMFRLWASIGIGVLGCASIFIVCAQQQIARAVEIPSTQSSASTRPFKVAFEAMTYYDQSCAHCHGPQGSFYGPTLGNDLTDDGLIKKCHAMAAGPGNSPLSDEENLVETAYHRSLIMHTPFVSVTDMSGSQWSGETTPGAAVVLHVAGKSIQGAVTDWNWTASLPVGTQTPDVTIEATVKNKTTTLKLSDLAYSNSSPLPPKDQRHK